MVWGSFASGRLTDHQAIDFFNHRDVLSPVDVMSSDARFVRFDIPDLNIRFLAGNQEGLLPLLQGCHDRVDLLVRQDAVQGFLGLDGGFDLLKFFGVGG